VALGEGVPGKAFALAPHFASGFGGVSALGAVGEKLTLNFLEFRSGTEFSGHSAPKNVGLGQGESSVFVGHANHVFLVYHDSVGIGKNPQ